MPVYDYQAINKQGKTVKGVIEADSLKSVRVKLRDQSLIPLEVLPIGESKLTTPNIFNFNIKFNNNSLTVEELALITRQLATLLSSGLPVEESLLAVAEQSDNEKITRIIRSVRSKVMEGHSLSAGMAEYKNAFPELYRATIHAGEHSGYLYMVLDSLADYTEKQFYFKQKIRQASVYPTLMIFVSTIILVFLLIYVVPKMVDIFKDTGHKLPLLTVGLLAISNFLQNFGLYLLAGIIVGVISFKKWLKNLDNKYKLHRFLLTLPLIKKIIKVSNTARFARTFGILSRAGVSVLEAMSTANHVVTNMVIHESLDTARKKVKEGVNISRALKETTYFPAMSIHLIASGEGGGKLDQMLDRAAEYQEKDIENLVATFISLFEPIMIIVMGFLVLLIVLAILLPIFQMNQFIK